MMWVYVKAGAPGNGKATNYLRALSKNGVNRT